MSHKLNPLPADFSGPPQTAEPGPFIRMEH